MAESREPDTDAQGEASSPVGPTSTEPDPAPGPDQAVRDDTTIGTGTSIALGCIAGTLLLVVIGLIFLGILWIIG